VGHVKGDALEQGFKKSSDQHERLNNTTGNEVHKSNSIEKELQDR
jgi:hypothetical protein